MSRNNSSNNMFLTMKKIGNNQSNKTRKSSNNNWVISKKPSKMNLFFSAKNHRPPGHPDKVLRAERSPVLPTHRRKTGAYKLNNYVV